ncbi:unnamed protein product [Symbiodinium sp. CCMP2592]|nr:unnamed protein product [Symbiodinium sp. CCMP2592]
MEETYEKKFRALKRPRPLWQRVVLQTPPIRLLRCLLIRAFFDHWYQKTEVTTDEWEARRPRRSYKAMLASLGAEDILKQPVELCWKELNRPNSSKYRHHRKTTVEAVLQGRINWSSTDRATLLIRAMLEKVPLRDGQQRHMAVVLGRFSSVAFVQRLQEELPMPRIRRQDFMPAIQKLIRNTPDLSSLLSKQFYAAERNTVAKMSRKKAQGWFEAQVKHCKAVSERLGKTPWKDHAALLAAAFGRFVGKNVQSVLHMQNMTGSKLLLCGPGALKFYWDVQGMNRHALNLAAGPAGLEQGSAFIMQASKHFRQLMKVDMPELFNSRAQSWLSEYPALLQHLKSWLSEDDFPWDGMTTQFCLCELSRMQKRIFDRGADVEDEDEELEEEPED